MIRLFISFHGLARIAVAAFAAAIVLLPGALSPDKGQAITTFVVNGGDNFGDMNPGDGFCEDNDMGNFCTLRAAIEESNALGGNTLITFDDFWCVGGPYTLTPSGIAYPSLAANITIDATTPSGYAGTPCVQIDGTNTTMHGFTLSGGNSTIKGLAINRFTGSGIFLSGNGNIVAKNRIGTNAAGTSGLANGYGVLVQGDNNMVGGPGNENLLSGNGYGVFIDGTLPGLTPTGNTVASNSIGLNAAGTAAIANTFGVMVGGCSPGSASSNTVGGTTFGHGNFISGNTYGVWIVGCNGADTASNSVSGNYIGLKADYVSALGNTHNVLITRAQNNDIGSPTGGSSSTCTGGCNLIQYSTNNGVRIEAVESTGNRVRNNGILYNGASGVRIQTGASTNTVGGQTSAFESNLLSGNTVAGVEIASSNGNSVKGNAIGTDPAGAVAVPNGDGVIMSGTSSGNQVGSTTLGEGNLISGNSGDGVSIAGSSNTVLGNLIGTTLSGTSSLGNGVISGIRGGVFIAGSSNTVGGTTVAARNVISGNELYGVSVLGGNGNVIDGNYIGVDAYGEGLLGNNGWGVSVYGTGTSPATVGTSAAGNVIAGNVYDGVALNGGGSASTGIAINHNSIHNNGGQGIALGGDGVTTNDLGDGDTGPNNYQNFPLLSSAVRVGGTLTVAGSLNSTASTSFLIEFFANPSCDGTHGEGKTYLGSTTVTTNGSGNASFSPGLPATTLPAGQTITSTATRTVSPLDTSEFSQCQAVTCAVGDTDCDGYMDTAATKHQGPSNTDVSVDNCPGIFRPDQLNSDGNHVSHAPYYATLDKTWPRSDALGDVCDFDWDNDGISGSDEMAGSACGGKVTDPLKFDTDGDRVHDGAECALGSDPTNLASKPAPASCGPTTDADGDRLTARVEYCGYNTSDGSVDTDGDMALDGARDGCEAASLNADRVVNSGDQLLLAQEFARESSQTARLASMDITKDGAVNSGDQLVMAGLISPSGQCP
jgi:hypothetical protein